MNILIAPLGLAPAIVTEFIDELAKRNVEVKRVLVIATKKAMLSYHVLKLDCTYGRYGGRIEFYPVELDYEDVEKPEHCRAFRRVLNHAFKTAEKWAGGFQNVYVNMAGGRKTMPADALLLSIAHGVRKVYHVISKDIPGTTNVYKFFDEEEQKEIRDCSTRDRRPSEALLKKIDGLLHPTELDVHLVRFPIPELTQEERDRLEKELLQ